MLPLNCSSWKFSWLVLSATGLESFAASLNSWIVLSSELSKSCPLSLKFPQKPNQIPLLRTEMSLDCHNAPVLLSRTGLSGESRRTINWPFSAICFVGLHFSIIFIVAALLVKKQARGAAWAAVSLGSELSTWIRTRVTPGLFDKPVLKMLPRSPSPSTHDRPEGSRIDDRSMGSIF